MRTGILSGSDSLHEVVVHELHFGAKLGIVLFCFSAKRCDVLLQFSTKPSDFLLQFSLYLSTQFCDVLLQFHPDVFQIPCPFQSNVKPGERILKIPARCRMRHNNETTRT